MAAVYERAFRVRYYECDAYGHVNHANYLRYMQEAAFDASANVGYDMTTYQAMGRLWLVRETDISYLRPLHYGDTVIVRTWVQDFRRFRSRRAYALTLASSGEPVAEAVTEWVFLESETQSPVLVPEEMVAAFLPHGPADNVPPRERFPRAPAAPPGVFTMRRRVLWRDVDGAQHANNATYMAYFEDCSVAVAAEYGWPMQRIAGTGFAIIARRYRIDYRQPALLGDELDVATWVSNVRRATAVRHYTITRVSDGELLARAYVLWVWVDLMTGKPMRVPQAFLADFAANIVD